MTRIIGLDTETTGLDPAKGHKLIEVALLEYDFATRKLVDSFVQRIDPERPIDEGASEVHGIVYSDLAGCPTFSSVAGEIVKRIEQGAIMVAHNMKFDAPFLAHELAVVGQAAPKIELFCTMENARWATWNGKYPQLGELCFALGVDYDPSKAHAAEYDVSVMIECLWRGLDRGFYTLPVIKGV